jgi:hypothetical protein
LRLICSRLAASLGGHSDRSREFYEDQGLIPDETSTEAPLARKAKSWSDRLHERAPIPSPQLFHHWRRKWPLRAHLWLHRLTYACIFAGCDLKTRLGQSLLSFTACPESMRSLPLAAGLVGLLQEKPISVAFPTTVTLLGCNPSHKICLAAGRPPPHYGGDLELTRLPAF